MYTFLTTRKLTHIGAIDIMATSGSMDTTAAHTGDSITKKEETQDLYQNRSSSNGDAEKVVVPCPLLDKAHQDPFGDETGGDVKYRTMHWL